ncbi:MAG: S-adenosylmethionine:tRNA ribosyltransferase-isomerase [Candidatus Peribacteria bacterium]|nr:MAG: S-adenosylmethionine:tRNA ribosyltransferase-isomerase [Candidatus Peribacteria bacterium]
MHHLSDYTYYLPSERIAQKLAEPADSCKLLVYQDGTIHDKVFHELPSLLEEPCLFVFNNTKVLKARLPLWEGKGEIFYLHSHDAYQFDALVRPGKKFAVGEHIALNDEVYFEVLEVTPD